VLAGVIETGVLGLLSPKGFGLKIQNVKKYRKKK